MRLIGQMEAWTLTSESVLPPGRKTRALLAVVALSAPRPALRGRDMPISAPDGLGMAETAAVRGASRGVRGPGRCRAA